MKRDLSIVPRVLLLVATCCATGCTVRNGRVAFVPPNPIDYAIDVFTEDEYDRLWKQGYGYNNPNAKSRPD